tara:strand:+ start:393 stop:1031 length:639 start_codon:yes stop_codon:yes gene_type:complete
MACADLTKGRLYPCKKSAGGIKEVYISTNVDVSLLNYYSNINGLFDINNGDWFKFTLAGTQNTFTEVNAVSRNNRTNVVGQKLTIQLPVLSNGLGASDRVYADGGIVEGESCDGFLSDGGQDINIFNPLMWRDARVIVRDRNDATFLVGLEFGCDAVIESVTGGDIAEFSGHKVTFSATEKNKLTMVQNTKGIPIFTGTAILSTDNYVPNFS